MEKQITSLRLADRAYVVGQKGVKMIEANPPLYAIQYEDGRVRVFCNPTGLTEWEVQMSQIEIPRIVLPTDATKAP